jgi:hypothetical protein
VFPDSRRSRDQRELCFHARSFDASQLDASQQIVSPEFVGGKAATVRGPTQQAIGRQPRLSGEDMSNCAFGARGAVQLVRRCLLCGNRYLAGCCMQPCPNA